MSDVYGSAAAGGLVGGAAPGGPVNEARQRAVMDQRAALEAQIAEKRRARAMEEAEAKR